MCGFYYLWETFMFIKLYFGNIRVNWGIIEVLWGIVGDHWGYKLHRGIFEINLCCISDKKLINNVYT